MGAGIKNLALVILSLEHILDFQVELLSKQEKIEAWGTNEKLELEVNSSES